jgi:putative salt-induced outer membrane protein
MVVLALFLIPSFSWPTVGFGADVVVKGQALEGTVEGVTAEGVEFQTIYGKGKIVIPWADVDSITSDKEFLVLFSETGEVSGRIWGIDGEQLLVGETSGTAKAIPFSQIFRAITREQYETSRLEAMRVRYRYWSGYFDLGFSYTDATTDVFQFSTGLGVRRKKKPTDFTFDAFYRYGTTKQEGQDRILNDNVAFGRARLDYDITERLFGFGLASAEYNEVQQLRIRTDPTAGVGYRFVMQEKITISGRSGLGYVYQKFFDGVSNSYFTILFGGDLEADLPYNSKLKWNAEYLPAIDDWTENYIIRTALDWTMPIIGYLDFKLSLIDVYNSRPAPGTQRNNFTSILGISFRF